ncbi:adenosylmethionine decarboxylase [Gongronella butleri]|nr:adenosylmethionine decarboxylase [Gongronella butleri]
MIHPSAPPPCSGDNYSAEHGCFEGPEKLLEVWFARAPVMHHPHPLQHHGVSSSSDLSDDSAPPTPTLYFEQNLRAVPKAVWDEMLAQVKCTVVDVIRNDHVDAYLLSESSMFVYPHKIILKTCGTTTLLQALPAMMDIASKICHLDTVYRVFYSRKAFMFPDKQPALHKSWHDEVAYLDTFFDQGASYIIGDTNAEEWHLYLTPPFPGRRRVHHVSLGMNKLVDGGAFDWPVHESAGHPAAEDPTCEAVVAPGNAAENDYFAHSPRFLASSAYRERDETLEILMTGLDARAMEPFYQQGDEPGGTAGGRRVDRDTGLDKLHPAADVNSYLFEPCGYSANGLQGDGYYTIHVTPEPQCSYASFESTIPPTAAGDRDNDAISALVANVIAIFQPTDFTVTYFASKDRDDSDHAMMVHSTLGSFAGYRRKNKILHEFDGYDLVFGHYRRA